MSMRHGAHDLAFCDVSAVELRDRAALAQHEDPVGPFDDLFEFGLRLLDARL